jgi:hypothetical protein
MLKFIPRIDDQHTNPVTQRSIRGTLKQPIEIVILITPRS